jgi:hypothetical protein
VTQVVVLQPKAEDPQGEDRIREVKRRWIERYGPLVAEQLEPYKRYTLLRVGELQYAYTSYERCVQSLGDAWDAGLVPRLGRGGVRGVDLPDVAPRLQGVDSDLGELRPPDVASRRRFS